MYDKPNRVVSPINVTTSSRVVSLTKRRQNDCTKTSGILHFCRAVNAIRTAIGYIAVAPIGAGGWGGACFSGHATVLGYKYDSVNC